MTFAMRIAEQFQPAAIQVGKSGVCDNAMSHFGGKGTVCLREKFAAGASGLMCVKVVVRRRQRDADIGFQ